MSTSGMLFGMICETCGQDHKGRCTAHSRRDGSPCGSYPMKGQTVCRLHGGKAPQALAAGERRVKSREAAELLARYGEPVETDPLQSLLDALWRAAGAVVWLDQELARQQEIAAEAERPGSSVVVQQTKFGQDIAALAKLYGEWVDRQARYAKAAVEAGLDERMVHLAEAQGKLLADTIEAVLLSEELRLSEGQIETGRRLAAGQLRALPGGTT